MLSPISPQESSPIRRPPAPLCLPAAGVVGGIVFDDLLGVGGAPYLCALLMGTGLLMWPRARRESLRLATLLLAFGVGGLGHDGQARQLPDAHVLRHTGDAPLLARVTGTVITAPRTSGRGDNVFAPWWFDAGRTGFLLDADTIKLAEEATPATGLVKVTVRAPVVSVGVGDRVELFGWCYRLRPPDNPGQSDWSQYSRRRGICVGFTCDRRENLQRLETGRSVERLWDSLRRKVRGLLLGEMLAYGGREATLLDTMVLGRRGAIEGALNEAFIRIGCAHYLAVSGMHVGMLGLLVWFVCRAASIPVRGSAFVVIVVTVLYAALADPRPPILRATIMTVAVCGGLVLGRSANFLNSLSLAALVILSVSPAQLFDAGFQFSFSAVLAIVYVSPVLMRIPQRLRPGVVRLAGDEMADLFIEQPVRSVARRRGRWFELRAYWTWCAATAAWMVCAPLALFYFDRVSLWGWLASPLLLPFVFAVMAIGFGKLLIALLWPTLGGALTSLLQGSAVLLILVVDGLEQALPVPMALSWVPAWAMALAGVTIIAWLQRHRFAHSRWVVAGLGLLTVVGAASGLVPRSGDGRLRMAVLSVGRGTSIVLELPDGRALLYDSGASGSYDPGITTIVPYLRHRGISQLSAAFVSHPNLDHFGGLPSVISQVRVGPVLMTPHFERLSTARKPSQVLLEVLGARGHPIELIHSGSAPLEFGDVQIEPLWPPADLDSGIESNETSLVLRVSYAGRSILLTGDIEALAQGRLLADADIGADVLVLPHHGSPRHNTREFLAAVDPKVVISSTSARTSTRGAEYERIFRHVRHLCTADHGAIIVTLDAQSIEIYTHRPVSRIANATARD
ncbi:MAG: ComEC/Rec2 family competence protein [bacterium]|nr:ComEC/Rec2 family competence protein [bacterium]